MDFGTWIPTNKEPTHFNLFTGDGDDRSLLISVAADQPNDGLFFSYKLGSIKDVFNKLCFVVNDFNVTLNSYVYGAAPLIPVIDAGIWRLFKIPYTLSQSLDYSLFHDVSISTTYHIWTVSNKPDALPTQPHTYVGFLIDWTSDVSAPIIVAHPSKLFFNTKKCNTEPQFQHIQFQIL